MRVLLATTGSDGDVQPFFALGQRLLADGHEVRVASSDNFAARAAALGVPFVAVGPPWDEAFMHDVFARVLAAKSPLKQVAVVMDILAAVQRGHEQQMVELVRGFDVVAYQPVFTAAIAAARKGGVRHVSVQLAAMNEARAYAPTGDDYGRFVNAILWRLARAALRRATDRQLNEIVTAVGLTPWRDVLLRASLSTELDLVAVSPHVMPRDELWPAHTHVTGYLFVDEPPFTPDAALAAFAPSRGDGAEKDKPVVIGFGSMLGIDPRATTELVLQAVRGLDRRVVLLSGWAGIGAGELPTNVHRAGFVPHAWLFGRAACVVHHGGAGTTAAAARAGVPQTIVWHLGDQPAWGKRVAALGVGCRPRARAGCRAKWLREVIDRMLADDAMAAKAAALGAAIRAEDGVGNAARAIAALGAASRAPRAMATARVD